MDAIDRMEELDIYKLSNECNAIIENDKRGKSYESVIYSLINKKG